MVDHARTSGIMDIILTTNGTLLTHKIIDALLAIPITRINISVDAFSEKTYKQVRGGNFRTLVANIEYILQKRKDLPVIRLTFIDLPANSHEKEKFIAFWKERVDVVDIQKFIDLRNISMKKNAQPFHCSAPWRIIDIQANGDLVPCNSFFAIPDLIMGNIHNNSIYDIWNSTMFRMFRENLKQGDYAPSCRLCFGA
jgi:radical SAM protein with 4Fe4S-binding SPASM domain